MFQASSLEHKLVLGWLSLAVWRLHGSLPLYWRRWILSWRLRIVRVCRRRLIIPWRRRRLVVISRRRVLLTCHSRMSRRNERLVRRLRNDDSSWGSVAVVRATGTAEASHDGSNDRKEHDRTDYSACNRTSRQSTRGLTVAITTHFAYATIWIVSAVATAFSANVIEATSFIGATLTVPSTGCCTFKGE